jgi:hypothetical protein
MNNPLEERAANMLRSLTESLTDTPQAAIDWLTDVQAQHKDNPDVLKMLDELTIKFISKIPDITRVISDSTKILETYLTYTTSKRQEEATDSLVKQNKNLVKQTRKLTIATLIIAATNAGLVILTVLRFYA